jgi:hypothetical protein
MNKRTRVMCRISHNASRLGKLPEANEEKVKRSHFLRFKYQKMPLAYKKS